MVAYLRAGAGETLLVVANLADSAQPVELDLQAFKGAVPVDLFGGARFPAIDDRLYPLSLGPYGFYWFRLESASPAREALYGIERTAL